MTLREMVRVKSDQEILAAAAAERHQYLYEQETAKNHALKGLRLTEAEFAAFADYMLDGGGVVDRGAIARALAADLVARRQGPDFMSNLVHYAKTCLKTDGYAQPHAVPSDIRPGVANPVTLPGVAVLPNKVVGGTESEPK